MDASRTRAVLLLALTFAAGAAVGVAGDRLDLIPSTAKATETTSSTPQGEFGPSARKGRQTTIETFADELELTVRQRGEIEGALDHYRASARQLQQAVRPQYRSLMDSIRAEIESVLSDVQVEQYRELLEKRHTGDRERGPGRRGSDAEHPAPKGN